MSAAAVAARAAARAYASYGRVYRVERAGAARMFWAVGRARGLRASFLDRLGPRGSRDDMQEALDAWAARRGLRPVKEGMTATGQEEP